MMYPTIYGNDFENIYLSSTTPDCLFLGVSKKKRKKSHHVSTAEYIYNVFKYLNVHVKALSSTRIAFFEAIPKIVNHVSHSVGIDFENIHIEHYLGLMLEIYPLLTVSDWTFLAASREKLDKIIPIKHYLVLILKLYLLLSTISDLIFSGVRSSKKDRQKNT